MFEQFARLAEKGYPVAKHLAREKDVTDEEIYALGFRLIESGDGSNEELGAELLQGIIDERPRSKLAKRRRTSSSSPATSTPDRRPHKPSDRRSRPLSFHFSWQASNPLPIALIRCPIFSRCSGVAFSSAALIFSSSSPFFQA